jgi:hypothetical protein
MNPMPSRNQRTRDPHLLGLFIAFAFLVGALSTLLIASAAYAAPDGGAAAVVAIDAAPATPAAGTGTAVPPASLPAIKDDNPLSLIGAIATAVKGGHWLMVIALVLTILVWVFNKLLKERLPPKVLPWIAMGLSTLASFFASWALGNPWYTALGSGITVGLAAAGGWSAIMKHILPTKRKDA